MAVRMTDEEIKNIMDSHGEHLIRLAYFYVKDWAAAEDIMQETFISYYRKFGQFDNRASIKTYLSKITVNKCHDYLRSWKNKRSLFSNSLGSLISPNKSPEESFEEQTDQTNLTNKIMELPIKYREVILLFYYQEFTSKEISEMLGGSENTVKTRLRRAKDMLREKVDLKEREGMQDE